MVFFFLSPQTPYGRVRLASFARIRLLRHALPISLLILRNKPTVLESIPYPTKFFYSYPHRVYERTGGCTLTSSPNFLPSIGFHIPSHVSGMELRCALFARADATLLQAARGEQAPSSFLPSPSRRGKNRRGLVD